MIRRVLFPIAMTRLLMCCSGMNLHHMRGRPTVSYFSTISSMKRVLFLGSPTVAAEVLDNLYARAQANNFEIVSVVTQPPAATGRHLKVTESPVATIAKRHQLPVLAPQNARDPSFLSHIEKLDLDLCITAAYGNYLPKRFLSIPRYGTINIHPSLL